mgnify:CR=1 FL=1
MDILGEEFSLTSAKIQKLRVKNPGRVPTIVQLKELGNKRGDGTTVLKYLVSHSDTVAQFLYQIRKTLKINKNTALYLFDNKNSILVGSITFAELDHTIAWTGILSLSLFSENTFGYFFSC